MEERQFHCESLVVVEEEAVMADAGCMPFLFLDHQQHLHYFFGFSHMVSCQISSILRHVRIIRLDEATTRTVLNTKMVVANVNNSHPSA